MPKKVIVFPEKGMEGIFVYVLEYMLTLVSLDKCKILVQCTLMQKKSKSEGRAF